MIEKVTLQLSGTGDLVTEANRSCQQMNPKELLLYAGAKCAGMTILHIMQKEHLKPMRLEITLSGDLSTDTPQSQSVFRSFHVVYNVACGEGNEQAKASRAIRLAHDKYCGMMQMLRAIAHVTDEIAIVSTQPTNA